MSKTTKELYEDIAEIFTNNGICSYDFAQLTELYRRAANAEKRVIDEVIEAIRSGNQWVELLDREIIIEELKQKYGIKE